MPILKESMFTIEEGKFCFTFLNTGDLYIVTHEHIMLNQIIGNPVDGSLNNLYLRFFDEREVVDAVPLLGVKSNSTLKHSDKKVVWEGTARQILYKVTFILSESGVWFWNVELEGSGAEVDVIYAQDIGLASQGAVRSNESYMSQYIDHQVFNDNNGYVICSRQNMPQPGGFPYLQQGSLTKTTGYLTDGFQFYGLSYKETNKPEVLKKLELPNYVYQYEFAFAALQSAKVLIDGKEQFIFYSLFKENHTEAVTEIEFRDEVEKTWKAIQTTDSNWNDVPQIHLSETFGSPIKTEKLTSEEIDNLFPKRILEESKDGTLLSFFTATYEHIVLKEKELLVERPHGTILMTGNNDSIKSNTLTTTSYMYGIFNSQIVVGNTSFNKMVTNARNALNVLKTSGQRLYIELEGKFRQLTMPSLFEMGFNYTRWYYKFAADTIIVTNFTAVDSPELILNVKSSLGKDYRFIVTNQVTMNGNEYEVPFHIENEGQTITFRADERSDSGQTYPNLSYRLHLVGAEMNLAGEEVFSPDFATDVSSLVVLKLEKSSQWTMTIQGLLHGEEIPLFKGTKGEEIAKYRSYFKKVMNDFKLSKDNSGDSIEKVNALAWWYTHNMLVHFSVPHGLEQYGGAAWGTRDVCQGPVEYFLANQNDYTVKEIIKTVYKHQFEDDGNWPQWFMFDNYFRIQADESHGDIIVWPLKVLADYLRVTSDFAFLKEKVPYTIRGSFLFTEEEATILEHAKKEIQYIKDHFLHDTFLSSYGDGDWDDTLQPANAQLKQYMISSWTVSLTYQALNTLSSVLESVEADEARELKALADGIETDFNKYLLQTDVVPGFVYMEEPGKLELMVHPEDTKTGIHYRLLPMTRSIISELLTPEQAENHYKLIKEKLYCPDGVRLMNRPAQYEGGVSTNFKRAEQAANFGREIGLQYVHAHIRFVEAMAKLGKTNEVWKGLEMINPVRLQDAVPNAELRQSNAYFSSSDGKFNNRYEAQERFDELRKGTVPVKGGWRIYSSGPGIYMNQLVSNSLGIRRKSGDLIIDPILPSELDGLRFKFTYQNKPITFNYHLKGSQNQTVEINGEKIEAIALSNRYRQGGFLISKELLDEKLLAKNNMIDIYICNEAL